MPTTLTGLLLFVALLVPGFAYVNVRQRSIPALRTSVFREVAQVAIVSVIADVIALGICALLAQVVPDDATPDIESLIRQGREYIATDYTVLGIWSVCLLTIATVGALLAAGLMAGVPPNMPSRSWKRLRQPQPTKRLLTWLSAGRTPHPSTVSSWWRLFDEWEGGSDPDAYKPPPITVNCVLDDGSWIKGAVGSYNTSADDTGDRDLILFAPIRYAPPGEDQADFEASAVCISASRIVTMFVAIPEAVPSPSSGASAYPELPAPEAAPSQSNPANAGPSAARDDPAP